jgi:hypothetical protein
MRLLARILAEERVFPKGTRFEGSAWFDNSPSNKFNPDPKAEVRFGDQTWDEMMVGSIALALKPDQDLAKLVRMPAPKPTTGAPYTAFPVWPAPQCNVGGVGRADPSRHFVRHPPATTPRRKSSSPLAPGMTSLLE